MLWYDLRSADEDLPTLSRQLFLDESHYTYSLLGYRLSVASGQRLIWLARAGPSRAVTWGESPANIAAGQNNHVKVERGTLPMRCEYRVQRSSSAVQWLGPS
ncbi:hypothetical protein N7468_000075 [Penicillium chermesinum]|uniref:Uncharacterized protein n=1 Tax=Penicillium chermesinum TaxID=63820 RepID=A0A9W9PKX7_9EURO|nr:uncharacterized protein N7468_000075 [Penicillium chermesinum]KAJ5248624.1 hypothetical protein N7468_000075 [Penicillium chermesinum]